MRKRNDGTGQKVFTRNEMIGRFDQCGDQITRFIRQARDSKGSDGMVYEARRPDGTLHESFVHIRNHVPWWYRTSITDPLPEINLENFGTIVPRFYEAYRECLAHNETLAKE